MTFQHNANGNCSTLDTSNGQYLAFNPASGQLVIVPEPSTWVLACLGEKRCQPPNLGKIPDTPKKVAGTFSVPFPFPAAPPASPRSTRAV